MDKGKAVMGSGRRWAVEFTDNSIGNSSRDIFDPPGFTRASQDQDDSAVSRQKKDAEATWKSQKWNEPMSISWFFVAIGILVTTESMGSCSSSYEELVHDGLHDVDGREYSASFSIGITFSALFQPINALRGVGKVFEPFKDKKVDLLTPKLAFIALNLVGLGLGVWKLNTLGLLPTHVSDWVSSLPPPQEIEYSSGGIPL